eukprot:gene7455-595_t
MDTLLIIGLHKEYLEARGLLSAFYLSGGDKALLAKAVKVGDRILHAYNSPQGIATLYVDMSAKKPQQWQHNVGKTNVASAGTNTMELTTLSRLTGRKEFADAALHFWEKLPLLESCDGLYCTWFDAEMMVCTDVMGEYSFGASSDSLYEYMLKQWLLSGKTDTNMLAMYKASVQGMHRRLVYQVPGSTTEPEGDPEKPEWIVPESTTESEGDPEKPEWIVGLMRKTHTLTCSTYDREGNLVNESRTIPRFQFPDAGSTPSRAGSGGSMADGSTPGRAGSGGSMADGIIPGRAGSGGSMADGITPGRAGSSGSMADGSTPGRAGSSGSMADGSTPGRAGSSGSMADGSTPSRAGSGGSIREKGSMSSVLLKLSKGGGEGPRKGRDKAKTGGRSILGRAKTGGRSILLDLGDSGTDGGIGEGGDDGYQSDLGYDDGNVGYVGDNIDQSDLGYDYDTVGYGGDSTMQGGYDAAVEDAGSGISDSGVDSDGDERKDFGVLGSTPTAPLTPEEKELRRILQLQHFTCFVPGLLVLVEAATEVQLLCSGTAGARAPLTPGEKKLRRILQLQHFTCFVLGMLVLDQPVKAQSASDLELAAKLMPGCYNLYRQSPSGVAPDVIEWNRKIPLEFGSSLEKKHPHATAQFGVCTMNEEKESPEQTKSQNEVWARLAKVAMVHRHVLDPSDHLRPEVVESLYMLYKATGDEMYREWGWSIFRAFDKHCRLPGGGYATLKSVFGAEPTKGDRMESFWLAETLKYLYLLFSYGLNTHAPPFPVWGSKVEEEIVKAAGIKLHDLKSYGLHTHAHPFPVWGSKVEEEIVKTAGIKLHDLKIYDSGDIELRFGTNQEPLRAHSQFLSLASSTVLAPMINAEDPKASYLMVGGYLRACNI